jgi:DNA-binding Xre family transcriptional regulator
MVTASRTHTFPQTFLLDKVRSRAKLFAPLRPVVVSSNRGLKLSLARADKDSLWISNEDDLTAALLKNLSWPSRSLGRVVLTHQVDPATLPALANCFRHIAYGSDGFLPPNELAAALNAENRAELFIGGSVDPTSQTITLWRGNLEPLTVPFAAFEPSGDGIEPAFDRFSAADCGQTICLGEFEAAADAVLYEFDADFRRRLARERLQSERSFGASLRRLRKQRGLRREDFAPAIAAKTIARIEQGKVRRIQPRTLQAIARRLKVAPDEIATY